MCARPWLRSERASSVNRRGAPRREYTLAFKRKALDRSAQCGVYAAARELGLAEQTLRNWALAQRRGTLERAAEVSIERMELSRLRAENARRTMRLLHAETNPSA